MSRVGSKRVKPVRAMASNGSPRSRGGHSLAQEALPRRTLEQALRIPLVLHSTYAGKSANMDDIATALDIGAQSPNTRYLVYAALAYGLVTKEGEHLSLSETGRKIVAPTYEGEDREGKVKALLTPSILSKFYTDYNGHSVPAPAHFPNVLESRFQVPREQVQDAQALLLENARFAGILRPEQHGAEPIVDLSASGVTPLNAVTEQGDEPLPISGIRNEGDPDNTAWSSTIFYITPIGEEGTEVRKHADMMLKHLLEPVAREFGLTVVRADKIERAGLITQQIFEHLARARLCIADLSYGNANAFYELSFRHVIKLPTIQVIRRGDHIPFDVSQGRTIIVDTSDVYTVMDRFESARRELSEHVRHIVQAATDEPSDDNPVHVYLPGLKVTVPS